VHPRIRERWLAQVRVIAGRRAKAGSGRHPAVILKPMRLPCSTVLCARPVSAASQRKVGGARLEGAEIEHRIQAQWPIEKKMTLAHYVVWTEAGPDVLAHKSIGLSPPGQTGRRGAGRMEFFDGFQTGLLADCSRMILTQDELESLIHVRTAARISFSHASAGRWTGLVVRACCPTPRVEISPTHEKSRPNLKLERLHDCGCSRG